MNEKVQELPTSTLRLNFLALRNQNFGFEIYRRECSDPSESRPHPSAQRYSLPVDNDNADERKAYWTAFVPILDFTLWACVTETNRHLTVRYLGWLAGECVKVTLDPEEYVIDARDFRRGVEIVMMTHSRGVELISIEPCYLSPSQKYGFLVDFHFRKAQGVPFDREIMKLSLSLDKRGYSNKDFYADKYRKLQDFIETFGSRVFSTSFGNGKLDTELALETIPADRLSPKRFVFGKEKEYGAPYSGIERYGPSSIVPKTVRFALIFSTADRPLVNELAAALMGRSKDVSFPGMPQMFKLSVGKTIIVEEASLSTDSIDGIVNRLDEEQRKDSQSIVMPLVVMRRNDVGMYRCLKYRLLQARYPIQVVTTELLQNRNTLKWSVANIALGIFVKAGGQPWKVVPSVNRCLIFGIGQAHDHDTEGNLTRYFSYLVCTDSTGLYRRSDVLGASLDQASYLLDLGRNIVRLMKEELGTSFDRCVLHVPFKLRGDELRAIEDALTKLRDEDETGRLQFVVLRVNEDTKYFAYAPTTSLIPFECTFAHVSSSPSTYLVWVDGLQAGSPIVRKQPGGPLQVEFHWPKMSLTPADERLLLQDLLNLSGCNWRGFNSKHLPISIYYCQLIAGFLRSFGAESVDISAVPYPWFL